MMCGSCRRSVEVLDRDRREVAARLGLLNDEEVGVQVLDVEVGGRLVAAARRRAPSRRASLRAKSAQRTEILDETARAREAS